MKFITAEQRTPEWYKARLGIPTASSMKFVVAMGVRGGYLASRETYKRQIVAERLYGIMAMEQEGYVSEAMKWGITNEPLARTQYKLRTKNKVTEEGFCVIDGDDELAGCVGASTDGLVNDNGNLEIKCLVPSNHLYAIFKEAMNIFDLPNGDPENLLPLDYKAQVQTQLWVTGREWCDFVGYDSRGPIGLNLFVVRVYRDEVYIEFLRQETIKFLEEVDRDVNKFLDYTPLMQRVCRECGLVQETHVNYCIDCMAVGTILKEIIQPAKYDIVMRATNQKLNDATAEIKSDEAIK